MGTIADIKAPWRMRLQPASFAGVQYHVEQQARSSGRRTVTHEYPKRDRPYAEDMGQQAIRYQITGYVIGPSYHLQKQALIAVLESPDQGELVDPYLGRSLQCICERYSVTETRERGGYASFDMVFVEVGVAGNSILPTNTSAVLSSAAGSLGSVIASTLNTVAKQQSVLHLRLQ